ncbi:hypothetical protein LIA77_04558 [Sarocladium implicatum]|nr:hypothetical protein LIA77_04558 [Sarocladium implicatum]
MGGRCENLNDEHHAEMLIRLYKGQTTNMISQLCIARKGHRTSPTACSPSRRVRNSSGCSTTSPSEPQNRITKT